MPKPKQIVHAQIKNPILVRKTLLESAILVTEMLKSFQAIKKIRAEKKHYKNELKINFEDIKKLIEKLSSYELPRTPAMHHPNILKQVKKEIKKEVTKRVEQEKMVEKGKGYSDLDNELKKLQEKLKNL